MASTVAALIFATISGGVFAGTKNANHDETSKPGTVIGDRRQVGHHGDAFPGRHRDAAHFAGLDVRKDRWRVIEGDVEATWNEIVDRGSAALVRNVRQLDMSQVFEQLAGEVQRRPTPDEP